MIYALILGSGIGSRMGNTTLPKQFLKIGNKPIIIHTIEQFILSTRVNKIIVVVSSDYENYLKDLFKEYKLNNIDIVIGGSDRSSSMINGCNYILDNYAVNDNDIIITHDAVRPFVTSRIINDNIDKIKNAYYNLSKKDSVVDNKISIFYISAYGNTEKMANYIKMGLEKKGFLVGIYEITSYDTSELVKIIETSKGILVGTPTINQDAVRPAWDLLNSVCPINVRGKVASAFGSFGWSGEGVPMILSRMKDLKFNVLSDGLRFKFVPYNKEYADADEFIEKYIKLLK